MTCKDRIILLMEKNNINLGDLLNNAGLDINNLISKNDVNIFSIQELYSIACCLHVTLDFLLSGLDRCELPLELIDKVSTLNRRGKNKTVSYVDGLLENDDFLDKSKRLRKAAAFCKEVVSMERLIITQQEILYI